MNRQNNDSLLDELLNLDDTLYNGSQVFYDTPKEKYDAKSELSQSDLESIVACSIDLMEDVSFVSQGSSGSIGGTALAVKENSSLPNYDSRNHMLYPMNSTCTTVSSKSNRYTPQNYVQSPTMKKEHELHATGQGLNGCSFLQGNSSKHHPIPTSQSNTAPAGNSIVKYQGTRRAESDVFIPVNLLRLLKDVGDEEDDIKEFLESENVTPNENDTTVFKTGQVNSGIL